MPETNTFDVPGELITVVQLPIIKERLRPLKERWEQRALEAESMVCTEETIQAVKAFRADMRKEFDEVEAQRKAAKEAVMAPYNRFDAIYKEYVTEIFRRADGTCAQKISEVEADMKRRCEEGLREYFAELCAVHRLDWLPYERAGIKIDMVSAKAKTPGKLRKQLAEFVVKVSDGVNLIDGMEDSEEIMVEFRRSLDAAQAIQTVLERRRRVEDERAEKEARRAAQAQEAEMVRRVEALAPPKEVPASERTIEVRLIMHPTKAQFEEKIRPILKQLKQICDMEGIKYE